MITVVTAYYKIPSKSTHEFYMAQIKRWVHTISVPVIFYTTAELKKEISEKYKIRDNIRFVILPLEEWEAWKKFGYDFWKRQKSRDPEVYHTMELGAIWFEKKEFILRAMNDAIDSDVFIWCDAGCVRDDISENEMKNFGLRSKNLHDGHIHLQHIREQPKKDFYVYPEYRFAGAIIAGNRAAWIDFSKLYDETLKEYDQAGISCISDQYIINRCYDKQPSFFVAHRPPNCTVSPWFFFLQYL